MTTATDIILKAKALIERDGWTQKADRRTDVNTGACTGRCLVGALEDATPALSDLGYPAYYIARRRLETRLGLRWGGLALEGWNDAPDRTKEDVLNLLAEAAK